MGKLVNGFIKEGKKHTVERQILNAFVHAKTQINHNALEVLLDSIERVKPILNLGSYVKSGKKIEYPVLLKSEKRRRIALQNIMKLTKVMKERRLYQRVLEGLVELTAMTEEGKHDLKENRDELFDLVSAKGENLKQARNYLRGR